MSPKRLSIAPLNASSPLPLRVSAVNLGPRMRLVSSRAYSAPPPRFSQAGQWLRLPAPLNRNRLAPHLHYGNLAFTRNPHSDL